MKPGKLDKRITLQAESRVADAAGGVALTWANISTNPTVWANVRALSGRERVGADRVEAEAGYLFTIRNRSDITEKNVIVWNSRTFNIKFVRDLENRPLYIEIETDQGVAV